MAVSLTTAGSISSMLIQKPSSATVSMACSAMSTASSCPVVLVSVAVRVKFQRSTMHGPIKCLFSGSVWGCRWPLSSFRAMSARLRMLIHPSFMNRRQTRLSISWKNKERLRARAVPCALGLIPARWRKTLWHGVSMALNRFLNAIATALNLTTAIWKNLKSAGWSVRESIRNPTWSKLLNSRIIPGFWGVSSTPSSSRDPWRRIPFSSLSSVPV